jgi:1-acyl-sn-glycerol-3-phosphate acyltransferase
MDEAPDERVVIPMHDDAAAERRRANPRRGSRRSRPATDTADVYAFTGADADGGPAALAVAAGLAPEKQSDRGLPKEIESACISAEAHDVPVARSATGWEQRATAGLSFLRRRVTGNYRVDDFGFDPDLAENVLLPAFRALYARWFRVEVNGIEHIPDTGGALLVANHSGGLWALDAAMTAVAVHSEHPAGRRLRMLAADVVFRTPGLSVLARRGGTTMACAADAERLLAAGELVGVWPEGFRGMGKPFRDRYQLQRFGQGGFVRSAIAAGVPIIPVSIVGGEEIHPVLGNAKALARILNLPYFPLTPTFPWLGPLGLVPLPSKWYIEFGAPISTEGYQALGGAEAEPVVIFDLTDQVRDSIQTTLYRLLVQRRSIWR